jgi:long-subunit fatty acid transport protein
MKRTLINIAILSTILGTGMAQAGGFDVSGQDTSIILKEGNLLEITSVSVSPSVTGAYDSSTSGGVVTDVAPDYTFTNLAFRTDISDDISLAIIQDQPYGAKIKWNDGESQTGAGAVSYKGVQADIKSDATTALISYSIADNVTVYGGLKNQSISATASNPVVGVYSITSEADASMGYIVGAAVEKPEIALKIALTYHSKVGHDLAISESYAGSSTPSTSTLSFNTPEAFNLDFQTGIAANTLLFGTIRHVNWKQFELRPCLYETLTRTVASSADSGASLKKFDHNATTYTIGLGRKLSDQWSAAVTYGTESATGDDGSALGPTDGFSKMGVGVTYTGEQMTVTLAVQKANLGDTTIPLKPTSASTVISQVDMTGNTSLVTAVKVGYKF